MVESGKVGGHLERRFRHRPPERAGLTNACRGSSRSMSLRSEWSIALVGVWLSVLWGGYAVRAEGKPVSFARDVAPVLLKQCQACHGPEKSKGKYRVDSFERLMKAGESDEA